MSEPETGPELPEELHAVVYSIQGGGAEFVGCSTRTDIVAYRTEAEAARDIDRDKPKGREWTVLVGVNPSWRERALTAEAEVERLRDRKCGCEMARDFSESVYDEDEKGE